MKIQSFFSLATALVLTVVVSTPVFAGTNVHAWFADNDQSAYYGVHGTWTTPANKLDIQCPSGGNNENYIDSFVKALNGNYYLEGGVRDSKLAGFCSMGTDHEIYFEISTANTGFTFIDETTPGSATRDYALNRLGSSNCNPYSYCWYFRVDGGSKVDDFCCPEDSSISSMNVVRAGMFCHQDAGGASDDCASTAELNTLNSLTYKPTASYSGTWPSWAGKDNACVDYSQKARGVWATADSINAGFNVSISNSLTC